MAQKRKTKRASAGIRLLRAKFLKTLTCSSYNRTFYRVPHCTEDTLRFRVLYTFPKVTQWMSGRVKFWTQGCWGQNACIFFLQITLPFYQSNRCLRARQPLGLDSYMSSCLSLCQWLKWGNRLQLKQNKHTRHEFKRYFQVVEPSEHIANEKGIFWLVVGFCRGTGLRSHCLCACRLESAPVT